MIPLTREEPAPGLVVWQPARGFRYAMDPFLLAGFALEGGAPETAMDIGTGSGIMALLLARLGVRVTAVDVVAPWLDLARRSAADSGIEVRFVEADARELPPARHDLALLNPPYLPLGRGPVSPDPWRAGARWELRGTLAELVAAAARQAGRVCLVLPEGRGDEGVAALAAAGRPLVRRCEVDGALVLLEGREGTAGAPGFERVALRDPDGTWSARTRAWYGRLGARLRQGREGFPGDG